NKESSSSKPVVFPVPPPDDLTQPSSQSLTPVTPQKSSMATQNLPEQHVSERSQALQQTSATDISSAGSISGDIIDELMSSDGGKLKDTTGHQKQVGQGLITCLIFLLPLNCLYFCMSFYPNRHSLPLVK
ncbi:E2F5 isoform 4, partial [Pan troglodytes]